METYKAHETAVIDPGCTIGDGTHIWHFSHIMTGCSIGRNCNIGQNVVISPLVGLGPWSLKIFRHTLWLSAILPVRSVG